MRTKNIDQYEQIHSAREYGNTAVRMRRFVEPWVRVAAPASLLDYGAGQSRLGEILAVPELTRRDRYDPAIPALSTVPAASYDLVTCIDVMEHLEPGEVGDVLRHIASLSSKAIFIIDTKPARTFLPDGRNAHTTLRSAAWWSEQVRAVFPAAERIPVSRRGRVGLKTWRSGFSEWYRFRLLFAAQALRHRLWRLRGGHY